MLACRLPAYPRFSFDWPLLLNNCQEEDRREEAEKLTIKKLTLRDLDTQTLDAIAGGSAGPTWNANCTSTPCTTGYTRGFCERLGPDNQGD